MNNLKITNFFDTYYYIYLYIYASSMYKSHSEYSQSIKDITFINKYKSKREPSLSLTNVTINDPIFKTYSPLFREDLWLKFNGLGCLFRLTVFYKQHNITHNGIVRNYNEWMLNKNSCFFGDSNMSLTQQGAKILKIYDEKYGHSGCKYSFRNLTSNGSVGISQVYLQCDHGKKVRS